MRSDSARDAVPVRAMPRQRIGSERAAAFSANEFGAVLVDSATFSDVEGCAGALTRVGVTVAAFSS